MTWRLLHLFIAGVLLLIMIIVISIIVDIISGMRK